MAVDALFRSGVADADPHAAEIGAEMLVDRPQPVMARQPTAHADFDLEGGEVEFVVEHRQRIGFQLVEPQRLAHRAAAFVHEGRGLEQQHLVRADPAFLRPAGKLLLDRAEIVHRRDDVDRHEADIVPVHRIFRSGISKACPDLHAGSSSDGGAKRKTPAPCGTGASLR